jgi:hypothetical protein
MTVFRAERRVVDFEFLDAATGGGKPIDPNVRLFVVTPLTT